MNTYLVVWVDINPNLYWIGCMLQVAGWLYPAVYGLVMFCMLQVAGWLYPAVCGLICVPSVIIHCRVDISLCIFIDLSPVLYNLHYEFQSKWFQTKLPNFVYGVEQMHRDAVLIVWSPKRALNPTVGVARRTLI